MTNSANTSTRRGRLQGSSFSLKGLFLLALITVSLVSSAMAMPLTELMDKVVLSFAAKLQAESSQQGTESEMMAASDEYEKLSDRLMEGLSKHLDDQAIELFLKKTSEMDKVSRMAFSPAITELNGMILASLQEKGPDASTIRRIEIISRLLTDIRENVPTDTEMKAYVSDRPFESSSAFSDATGLSTGATEKSIGEVQLVMNSCDDNGASLTISFPAINTEKAQEQGREFQKITMEGCGLTSRVGYPSLPALRLFLALPAGGSPRVKTSNVKSRTLTDLVPYPVQPPLLDMAGYTVPFTLDEAAYSASAAYPSKQVQVTRSGKVRDMNILLVEIHPTLYKASKGSLTVLDQVSLDIDFGTSGASIKRVDDPTENMTGPGFKSLYRGMFLNSIKGSGPTRGKISTAGDAIYKETPENGAEYLIIAADDLVDAIEPLAQWKRQKGLYTKVVKVSEIPGDTTDPENIRNFVRKCYSTFKPRPSYLLLVGDIDRIPTFHRVMPTYGAMFGGAIGSDHYYSMVDGKDLFSDIMVGRLSGANAQEITDQVNKIVNYEKSPYMEDNSWFRRILSAGYKQDGRIFHETAIYVRDYMQQRGFQVRKVFSWEGDTTANIIDAFNEGISIVSYRGHGQPQGWDVPEFKLPALASLANEHILPVMFGTTCLSGNFDNVSADCFGEAIMKLPASGTVGFLGASKPSYSFYNDEFLKGMYWGLYQDGLTTIGEVMAQGQTYMVKKYGIEKKTEDMFEFYSILTDPSLAIWSDVPSVARVVCKTQIDSTVKRFGVEVTREDGSAVEDARVTLIKDDDNYFRARSANENGRCAFDDVATLKSGDLSLTITGRNIIPQTIIIPVKK